MCRLGDSHLLLLLLVHLLLLQLQLSLPHVAAKLHSPLFHRQSMQLLHLLGRKPAESQLLQLLLILLLRPLEHTASPQHHSCSVSQWYPKTSHCLPGKADCIRHLVQATTADTACAEMLAQTAVALCRPGLQWSNCHADAQLPLKSSTPKVVIKVVSVNNTCDNLNS